jgi:hypothetical protein
MKRIATLAGLFAAVALCACSSTKTSQVSPGAVEAAPAVCTKADGSGSGQCGQCPASCTTKDAVRPGAVGGTSCTGEAKQCPVTGSVSPGAVSEKPGCCKKG